MLKTQKRKKHGHKVLYSVAVLIVVLLLILGVRHIAAKPTTAKVTSRPSSVAVIKAPAKTNATTTTQPVVTTPKPVVVATQCSSNTLGKVVIVSISARHMWACEGSSVAYDSAVITGIQYLPADLTPIGTYHIYGKLTNTYLKGCDGTGCWNDYVSYFLEFLDNQYGIYGFHDATWRPANAFGNVDPNTADASHGCVELPLAASTWLYNWAPIGTTVSVVS